MMKSDFPTFTNYYTRAFVDSDFAHIMKLRTDAQVQTYHPDGIFSETKAREYFNALRDHYNKYKFSYLPIFEKNSDRFVGICGLMFFDAAKENFETGEVQTGYAIMPEFWGKGVATEISSGFIAWGLKNLPIKRVIAVCNPINLGSIKVVKKSGGKFVAIVKNPRVGDIVEMYEIVKS